MAFIKSRQISAYPVVNRNPNQSGDIYSRHTSEETITGIINKFIDREGFVITPQNKFYSDSPFAFNIHGYYFKVESLKTLLDTVSTIQPLAANDIIYATIEVLKHGQWVELSGGDKTGQSGNDELGNTQTPDDESWEYTSVDFKIAKSESEIPASTDTKFSARLVKYVGDVVSINNWNNTGCYVPEDYYVKFSGTSFTFSTIDGGDLDLDL